MIQCVSRCQFERDTKVDAEVELGVRAKFHANGSRVGCRPRNAWLCGGFDCRAVSLENSGKFPQNYLTDMAWHTVEYRGPTVG